MLLSLVAASASAAWSSCKTDDALVSIRSAFSEAECDSIENLFESRCSVERDERPSHGISRRNFWLKKKDEPIPEELDWVLSRVRSRLSLDDHLEFALMHEFAPGQFFDWHVDTKPGDGTGRTTNVNVVLTSDFEGGALEIGSRNATLERGDLHAYPAALPHKVHDVSSGIRRTLVLAFAANTPAGEKAEEKEEYYWKRMRQYYESLCEQRNDVAKLHWIQGEFHESLGDFESARLKFADSYRATEEREQYAEAFADSGTEKYAGGKVAEAVEDLQMSLAIKPGVLDRSADLAAILWTLGRHQEAENVLAALLAEEERSSDEDERSLVPLHVLRSFVLGDLDGRRHDSKAARARAFAIDSDLAKAAVEQLEDLAAAGGGN